VPESYASLLNAAVNVGQAGVAENYNAGVNNAQMRMQAEELRRRRMQEDNARAFYLSQSGITPDLTGTAMSPGSVGPVNPGTQALMQAPIHALQANYERGLQRQDQAYADQLRQNNQIQDEQRHRDQAQADTVGYLPTAFPSMDWTGTPLAPDAVGPPQPSALGAYSLPPDLVKARAMENVKADGQAARFPTELDQKVQMQAALSAQAQETKKQRYIAAFNHLVNDQFQTPEYANRILSKQYPEFATPISAVEISQQLNRLQSMGVDPLRLEAIKMKLNQGGDPSVLIGQEATRHSVDANERAKLESQKMSNQYAQQLVQDRADEQAAHAAVTATMPFGTPPTPGTAQYAQYMQAVTAANAATSKRIKTEQAMIGAKIAPPQASPRNEGPVPGPMTGQPQAGVPVGGQDPFASALQQAIQQAPPGASEDQIFQLADRIRAAGGGR